MQKKVLIFAAMVLLMCFGYAKAQGQTQAHAGIQTQKMIAIGADSIWWQALQEAKRQKKLDPAILNLAVPGSTVETLAKRLNLKLPQDIAAVLVAIGINNFVLERQSPGGIAQAIWDLLIAVRIRAPTAEIILQSVLPTRAGDELNKDIVELNERLAAMANDLGIVFLDLHSLFCEADGITGRIDLVRDRNVHLTKQGKEELYELFDPQLQ